ncbi:hypothetical protein LshimejAT787_0302300 [Lyophyllum shimeji]|uniref:Uncharacterized protein n=1 Tax=Lyophyllum shimeji TaxID=47721 RepID=A0A9P3PIE6_LYOSH|nr:hypothetical protein LshimejAT787_0302300 [Lyophyllum shimeji]
MSFQQYRLGELSLHQPLPPHLRGAPASSTSTFSAALSSVNPPFPANPTKPPSHAKQPYGSGDTDDGYTLLFPNLEAFHAWRAQEEERQVVEFVKGDTHGSKAVPPRFKDHTKLVCARHSRSGRKKYVKKHPERVRKVPSRKIEGTGCPASISYKTYFDTDQVRACYISQHSHPIGPANLPFTRKGRKAAAAQRGKDLTQTNPPTQSINPTPAVTNAIAGPSTAPPQQPNNVFASSVSMIAPLPPQPAYQQPAPQPYAYAQVPQQFPPPAAVSSSVSHDRWENMATLFNSIRQHARGYEYPSASVAALETVLIRLYLESPVGIGTQPNMSAITQNHISSAPPPASTLRAAPNPPQANGSAAGGNASDGSGEESS